eukprot:scaffold315673_cov31-Tisochrysis_lutea.AAC.2
MQLLCVSATNNLPSGSTAKPVGAEKVASASGPSIKPAVPGTPATVVSEDCVRQRSTGNNARRRVKQRYTQLTIAVTSDGWDARNCVDDAPGLDVGKGVKRGGLGLETEFTQRWAGHRSSQCEATQRA